MINIAFCFDRNYRQHFAVALCSLLRNNFKMADDVKIYIVTDSIDDSFRKSIEKLRNGSCVKFEWVIAPNIEVRDLPIANGSHFSSAIYYRLFLSKILPAEVEDVIYLDSDTVCVSDVSDLFGVDISNHLIAGVLDVEAVRESNRMGVKNYVNSGVLIINLKRWREECVTERCIEWLMRNPDVVLGDQDAINLVCQNELIILDRKWNACVNPEKIVEFGHVKIIHYISHMKPWQSWYDDQLGAPYQYFLKQTDWANSPPDDPKNVPQCLMLARKFSSLNKHASAVRVYEQVINELVEYRLK